MRTFWYIFLYVFCTPFLHNRHPINNFHLTRSLQVQQFTFNIILFLLDRISSTIHTSNAHKTLWCGWRLLHTYSGDLAFMANIFVYSSLEHCQGISYSGTLLFSSGFFEQLNPTIFGHEVKLALHVNASFTARHTSTFLQNYAVDGVCNCHDARGVALKCRNFLFRQK